MPLQSSPRRAAIAAGTLLATALALGTADAKPEPRAGVLVEILDQNNNEVRFELREIVPAHHDGTRMRFAKEIAPSLEEMAWYQVPLNPTDTGNLREIRIADAPRIVSLAGVTGEVQLHPVVIVPVQGYTASWYWLGERLSGVVRVKGAPNRPYSIPIRDVKVVRFVRESGSGTASH